jgi:4-methyl-5(b-hydroxyethyl)-thiazole monophosphate biosynthesis
MIYMFLAEGFEEVEALTPVDFMRRADIEVTTVGVGGEYITGAHGITVKADVCDSDVSANDADIEMVVLPGGMPGTLNLQASAKVNEFIDRAYDKGAFIGAICAAPSILGDMGLLRGKEAICYPGFEDRLTGARISEKRVVLDGKILTAAGMGAALDMGLKIVEIFCSEKAAADLRHAVIAD